MGARGHPVTADGTTSGLRRLHAQDRAVEKTALFASADAPWLAHEYLTRLTVLPKRHGGWRPEHSGHADAEVAKRAGSPQGAPPPYMQVQTFPNRRLEGAGWTNRTVTPEDAAPLIRMGWTARRVA